MYIVSCFCVAKEAKEDLFPSSFFPNLGRLLRYFQTQEQNVLTYAANFNRKLNLNSWICPKSCFSAFFGDNTVTFCSDSFSLYTSTVESGLHSANAALPPHPRLQTSYPPFVHFVSSPSVSSPPPLALDCLSTPPGSSSPLTPSGFLNEILAVSEPEALNCNTLFRLIPLTSFVSRNLTLTHLPLSESLNFLLCDLIAFTPGQAFSLLMPRTLAAASSFSSGRAYPFLNFIPPLFLRLTVTLIM